MRLPDSYKVPRASSVRVGKITIGGEAPLVVQSMANVNLLESERALEQARSIVSSGGQLVRFTTPGMREVEALEKLQQNLRRSGVAVPLVADVHFRAEVALKAASFCDKVRINPGNFTESAGEKIQYTEAQFMEGLERDRKRLMELIHICKQHDTALRIGVNHGSLSRRIMSKFGDTPLGMVESAMEFLRVCHDAQFENVLVSLKSSNTRTMVHANRLLKAHMLKENLHFPIHLGVTESGDGPEGRIKSVVGIAALLQEGVGDTIRVSLTEPPENEIPVAKTIRKLFPKPQELPYHPFEKLPWDPFSFEPPLVHQLSEVGGLQPPLVLPAENDKIATLSVKEVNCSTNPELLLAESKCQLIMLETTNTPIQNVKDWLIQYYSCNGFKPIIVKRKYNDSHKTSYLLEAAGELGLLLIDGLISGIWLENLNFERSFNEQLSFTILQAARNRFTSTEYIACPSCGRTRFDIQSVLGRVKEKTGHLKGLTIAVMGCVVNGPGEMADANYGYIGAGAGKVSIYKGRVPVKKQVPENEAVDALLEVIKASGDWVDP